MPRREDLPSYKECRRCGVVLPRSRFTVREYKLKSGKTSFYLESRCNKCKTEISSIRYHTVIKHQREREHESRTRLLMDGKPILEWLKDHPVPVFVDYNIRKRFNDLREGKAKSIHIDVVDRFLIQIDMPELMNEWYPLDDAA